MAMRAGLVYMVANPRLRARSVSIVPDQYVPPVGSSATTVLAKMLQRSGYRKVDLDTNVFSPVSLQGLADESGDLIELKLRRNNLGPEGRKVVVS